MPTRETLTQYWRRWKYGGLSLIALLIATGLGLFFDAASVRKCVASVNLEQCYLFGKTFWNWLELIGVPLSLAILGYIFQQQQQKRANNQEKEEILQTYFDRLSTLLIDKNLLAIAVRKYARRSGQQYLSDDETELLAASVDVIRARTLSILRRFDEDTSRKSSVIQFLIEAEVISKAKINLSDVELEGADLRFIKLNGVKLSRANLSRTNFNRANLSNTKLWNADLSNANLNGTDLSNANLSRANLRHADLSNANLSHADLSKANLWDIQWNESTAWPTPEQVAQACNIPEQLKEHLEIGQKMIETPPP